MPRLARGRAWADLADSDGPALIGELRCQHGRSGEILSFEYDRDWLRRPAAFALDPDLARVAGPQYPAPDRSSFGIVLDSSPHRWGRVLMRGGGDPSGPRTLAVATVRARLLARRCAPKGDRARRIRRALHRELPQSAGHPRRRRLGTAGTDGSGIRRAPAFDINPSIERGTLSLAIDDFDATPRSRSRRPATTVSPRSAQSS